MMKIKLQLEKIKNQTKTSFTVKWFMRFEKQSYYPFGLQMAGISDKAFGKLDSKNKFNGGVELEEDYGVNLYQTFYRGYDPQIGRFNGVDCKSESSIRMSVYQFGGNNPVSFNDPLGDQYSYMDQTGTKWHSADPLAGTLGAGTPYQEGFGWDGFGGGGGGAAGGVGGGSGGNYSAFWNKVSSAVMNGTDIPGFTATGTTQYYDYSNLSESGIFETPNNDGVYTQQVGEMYHFIGVTDKTSYTINGDGESEKLTWWDYTKTSLDLTGALLETAVGVLTSETGIGAVAAVDGGARVAGNFTKLMIMTQISQTIC